MPVCSTMQTMSTGSSVRITNHKAEPIVGEEQRSSSMWLSTSAEESQTCEMFFFLQWLSVCPHICWVGGSRAGLTVSPAGSSRPARTITQTWFTARCAGKGQEALIHLRNNYLLKADYVQTSSFSFSGTELWTRHRVCSNRCTHVFTVLVYLFFFFFLFPYMSEICKMYCTRIAVKTNIMIQTATKHVLQLYLKRKDPTKSHKGDAHLGIKA